MNKKIWLLGVFAILSGFLASKDILAVKVLELYLTRSLPSQGVEISSLKRDGNCLQIENLSFYTPSGAVFLAGVHSSLHVSLFPPRLETTLSISDCLMTVEAKEGEAQKDLILPLFASPWLKLKLSVEKGMLQSSSGSSFPFSFVAAEESGEIGTLFVRNEEGRSFLSASLGWERESIHWKICIKEGQVIDLISLVSFVQKTALRGEGELSLSLQGAFHPMKGLERMEGVIDLEGVSIEDPSLGFNFDSRSLKGTLLFSQEALKQEKNPFWQNLDLFLTFEDSSLLLHEQQQTIGFKQGLGEIRLQPTEDPYLKMEGMLLSNHVAIPFEIEGKGQLVEKGNYWFQMAADFLINEKKPKVFFSFSQEDQGKGQFELSCEQISEELLDGLKASLPLLGVSIGDIEAKSLEGKVLGSFVEGTLQTIECIDCKAQELTVFWPAKEVLFSSKDLSITGTLGRDARTKQLDIESLLAKAAQSSCLFQDKSQVEIAFAEVAIDAKNIVKAEVEGSYEGVFSKLQVLERGEKEFLKVECRASSQELLKKIGLEQQVFTKDLPLLLSFSLFEEEKASAAGTIFYSSNYVLEQAIQWQAHLNRKISRNWRDLCSPWDFSTLQGSFEVENLALESIFLGTLQGSLRAEGSFTVEELSLDFSKIEGFYSDASWKVLKEESEAEKIHLTYDHKSKDWKGQGLIGSCFLERKDLSLSSRLSSMQVFFEEGALWTNEWKANIEEIQARGSFVLDDTGIHIDSHAFEGSISSFAALLSKRLSFPLPAIEGKFLVEDGGFHLDLVKNEGIWAPSWKMTLGAKQMVYNFGKGGEIRDAECIWTANSQGEMRLSRMHGVYLLGNAGCVFSLSDLIVSKDLLKPIDFTFLAKDEKRQWARVQGKIQKKEKELLVSFAPHSHLLGVQLSLAPVRIYQEGSFAPIEWVSSLKLEQMPSYFSMWKEMGLHDLSSLSSFLSPLQGTLHLAGVYDSKKGILDTSLKSSDLSYKGSLLGPLTGRIQASKGQVSVPNLQIGAYLLRSQMEMTPLEWKLPLFSLESSEGKLMAKGSYLPESSKWYLSSLLFKGKRKEGEELQLQGQAEGIYSSNTASWIGKGIIKTSVILPKFLEIESAKEIPFFFDSSKGFQAEKTDWNLVSTSSKQPIGKCSTKKISYLLGEKRLLIQEGSSNLSAKGVNSLIESSSAQLPWLKEYMQAKELDISFEADVSAQNHKISGKIKQLEVAMAKTALALGELSLLCEDHVLYGSCQTNWQGKPLYLRLQFDLNQLGAAVLIKESLEQKGLALEFKTSAKKEWFCQSIQGSLSGLEINAKRSKTDLEKIGYDLSLKVDLEALQPLFSKDVRSSLKKWGLGSGYAFEGFCSLSSKEPLSLLALSGNLTGERFTFLNQSFDHLSSKVEWTRSKGRIHSVKLEDEKICLSIKTIDFYKDLGSGLWSLSSPLIYVKDFAPALFLKGGKERGLELKNLSLYDLKGNLNSIDSFESKGALHFASNLKKEFSFWDVPFGMIKDWGLDPGLLTPVIGEADFILRHGRFYFTELRNVYSEGKRSQFYLAEPVNEAYLSLEGDWHVDLAMTQNVVWKITEDLIVSIRGTVEKPKYSFKKNKRGE